MFRAVKWLETNVLSRKAKINKILIFIMRMVSVDTCFDACLCSLSADWIFQTCVWNLKPSFECFWQLKMRNSQTTILWLQQEVGHARRYVVGLKNDCMSANARPGFFYMSVLCIIFHPGETASLALKLNQLLGKERYFFHYEDAKFRNAQTCKWI